MPESMDARYGRSAPPEPSFEDVESAFRLLSGVARRTPVMTSRLLNDLLAAELFLKCENFQRVGAFKFRGAYNAIHRLSPAQRERGVVTHSSGNHAQAVALVGQLLGVRATIVMPENAPRLKLDATLGYGASVVLYDPNTASREAISASLAVQQGYTLIPPYDHPDIIAGQGTAALELLREVEDLDLLLVPCGGGGLLSGCALVTKQLLPGCAVVGVEPQAGDDGVRSFRTGELQRVTNPDTIADGARTPCLADHLPHGSTIRGRHDGGVGRRAHTCDEVRLDAHEACGGTHRRPRTGCRFQSAHSAGRQAGRRDPQRWQRRRRLSGQVVRIATGLTQRTYVRIMDGSIR